jgi:hypothetical protein
LGFFGKSRNLLRDERAGEGIIYHKIFSASTTNPRCDGGEEEKAISKNITSSAIMDNDRRYVHSPLTQKQHPSTFMAHKDLQIKRSWFMP